ncbi:MAG: hypothetical protein R3C19_08250 [Planctomycetaceae bacterium]
MLIAVPLAVFLLLFLIVTVYVAVVRLRSKRDPATVVGIFVICSLLLLGVPVFFGLLFFARSSHSVNSPAVTMQRAGSTSQPREPVVVPMGIDARAASVPSFAAGREMMNQPDVWANLDQQPFDANNYPGRIAAAKPLAGKLRAALDANQLLASSTARPEAIAADDAQAVESDASTEDAGIADNEHSGPADIRLTSPAYLMVYDASAGNDVLQRFAEQLRAEFPVSEVRVSGNSLGRRESAPTVERGAVRLSLHSVDEHIQTAEGDEPSEQIRGELICHIETTNGSAQVSVNYIQKPWVEEFDAFVSARPQQRFVVGYSGQLVSSEEDARRLAMLDAQHKCRLAVPGGDSITVDESLVVDRFAQKLSRPYGDVWREAVLLDVSASRIAPALAQARHVASVSEQRRFSVGVSLAVLFAVTVLLCISLNLLTQGYYRRRLLICGAAVLGVGALTLMS